MNKTNKEHIKLKEDGWKEVLGTSEGYSASEKEIMRVAYDYGWYCAYGLKSDDKRHKEIMKKLKEIDTSAYFYSIK